MYELAIKQFVFSVAQHISTFSRLRSINYYLRVSVFLLPKMLHHFESLKVRDMNSFNINILNMFTASIFSQANSLLLIDSFEDISSSLFNLLVTLKCPLFIVSTFYFPFLFQPFLQVLILVDNRILAPLFSYFLSILSNRSFCFY